MSPLIGLREIASLGPTSGDGMVAEAHLAVSNSHVFVAHVQNSDPDRNGYTIKDKQSGDWFQQGNLLNLATDPSVAYDAANDRFVICELTPTLDTVLITWWDRLNGFQAQTPAIVTGGSLGVDKPMIVRGQNDLWRQEFYITVSSTETQYARTLDGGSSWTNEPLGVTSTFATDPSSATAVQDTPVYVVWTRPFNGEYRFLRGDDNGTAVDFTDLTDSGGNPVGVVPNRTCKDCTDLAPGPFRVKPSPHLATDPTDPDRLYLVYLDESAVASTDLDVFCVRLDRTPGTTIWTAGTPVRVNDDVNDPNDHFDQIQPDLAVDEAGRVHVIFYDDRNYIQADTVEDAKYDVFYAYSLDAGQTFTNVNLAALADEPALDHTLDPVNDVVPLEYPGIATFENEVWMSFAGTWSLDTTTPDKSVIWVAQAVFEN